MRLLLAEDEPTLSGAITAMLRKNNYEADAVFNGEDAIDYLKLGQYDGAILDVTMPKKTGFEVLLDVRKSGIHLPILMLTARSDVRDKVFALDNGANDYLTKPFHYQELLARIRCMTRKPGGPCTSKIHFGNISLDRADYELSSPYGSRPLTNKEYQLMEKLISEPRRLISTESLLENIWGMDSDAHPHVVWIYISYLRKKLTELKADVRIRLSRGVGYALEELSGDANT